MLRSAPRADIFADRRRFLPAAGLAFLARASALGASGLLLDEPFNGVPIRTEQLMEHLFDQFRRQGHSILISTHVLSHVRNFCNRVVLIKQWVLAYGETSEVFTR